MICKVSQCYKIIAFSFFSPHFSFPFQSSWETLGSASPCSFSSCSQALIPFEIPVSLSLGSCSHLLGEGLLLSIAALLNFCFLNHPTLWQLICALHRCMGRLLCIEFPSPGCDSLAWFSFRQTNLQAVVLGDYLISAFERASLNDIMVTCWLPVREWFSQLLVLSTLSVSPKNPTQWRAETDKAEYSYLIHCWSPH